MPTLSQTEWNFVNNGVPSTQNPNYLCTISCTDQDIQIVASLPDTISSSIGANYEEAFAQILSSNSKLAGITGPLRALGVQLTTQALTAQVWQGSTEMVFDLPLVLQAETNELNDVLAKLEDLYQLTLPGESFANGFLTAPGPVLDPKLLAIGLKKAGQNALNSASGFLSDNPSAKTAAVGALAAISNAIPGTAGLVSSTSSSAESASTAKPSTDGSDRTLISAIKNNISLQLGRYMYFESVVITNVGQTHYVQPLESGVMSRVEVNVGFKTFFVPTKKDIPNIFRNSRFSRFQPGVNSRRGL